MIESLCNICYCRYMNIKRSLYKKAMRWGFLPAKVIILMDGGICSQMNQYLLGQLFAAHGYKVCYDISFFKNWGSDINHKYVRNFDLLKAFPYLKFHIASQIDVDLYKRYYCFEGNAFQNNVDYSFLELTPPVYLDGYYKTPNDLWIKKFHEIFRLSLGALGGHDMLLFEKINSCDSSVAVHVRRGDLSTEVVGYGLPATITYFQRAIAYICEHTTNPMFYFFSDEIDWVLNELIPTLDKCIASKCEVVADNGSDKGYIDLFLMAACKHQITSKGTLGKFSALLSDSSDKIVILCDDATQYSWKERLHNPIFM